MARRVFFLSPANCGGERAQLLFSPRATFDLARRLREPGGAPLGEVMSFVSGLYFRGKLTYAARFGVRRDDEPHAESRRVRDRKSTRLNSSHQISSYSVFCFKKKHQPTQARGL